jgi:CHAT domain
MTVLPSGAVLSVADAASGQDHAVKLAVRGLGAAGLPDASRTAVLARPLAEELAGDADAMGRCLGKSTLPGQRAAVGDRLSAAILSGQVAELWARVAEFAASGHPLRIRLDIRPGPLRALPWELLRWGDRWTFPQKHLSAWRGPVPQAAEDPDMGPVRVLIVVCNPLDHRIRPDEELAFITGGLAGQVGQAFVEILDGPDRRRLSHEINRLRPHVLHFIGHGMPRTGGNDPELWFNWVTVQQAAAATSAPWGLPVSEIAQLADWQPRLVVINACRTAADALGPIGGFSDAFLAAGTRAVVSMQADIESSTALQFSEAFYKELGRVPLDEVVARARRQLIQENGDTGEWAMPVLAARTDPVQALGVVLAPAASLDRIAGRPEYVQLRDFLNRSAERRDAWWALDPEPHQAPSRPVLVIRGRPVAGTPAGKTWFARWCLLTYFLRGHRVTYVDLAVPVPRVGPDGSSRPPARSKNWLDVLRVIRDACTAPEQLEPLPEVAFSQFNASLNELVVRLPRPGKPADRDHGSVADESRPFSYENGHYQERIDHTWAGFLGALRQASAERRHIIALDGADSILAEEFSYVYEGLIRPVAQDVESAVRLMLVGPDDWLGMHLPPADAGLWTSVQLEGFDSGQFMRLARDYCYRVGLDISKVLEVYAAYEGIFRGTGKRVPLNAFCEVLRILPDGLRTGRR